MEPKMYNELTNLVMTDLNVTEVTVETLFTFLGRRVRRAANADFSSPGALTEKIEALEKVVYSDSNEDLRIYNELKRSAQLCSLRARRQWIMEALAGTNLSSWRSLEVHIKDMAIKLQEVN